MCSRPCIFFFFFFNDTATTEIYTLSLHDALPISHAKLEVRRVPEFKEATAPGAYYDFAAMDGTRPGIFFANLRDMNEVDRKSTRLNSSHSQISYAVFCLKKKKKRQTRIRHATTRA